MNPALRAYFGASYNLSKNSYDLWYYIQSENIILVKNYKWLKNLILVNCKGIQNMVMYSSSYDCNLVYNMMKYGMYIKNNPEAEKWTGKDEDIEWCDVVVNCLDMPKIPYEEDKDYIKRLDHNKGCCVYVRDLFKLFSSKYKITDMITQNILSENAIAYYDYQKNDFTATIPFENIKKFLTELGIFETDWLPVWRRIVNCYKIKENNNGR